MKVCRTCEHYSAPSVCYTGGRFESLFNPDKQSCTEHKERVEKKKVLIRWALLCSNDVYYLGSGNETGGMPQQFVRWITPEDWQNIMQGKEVEI